MADLRIVDAPELDESEVQGGLKIPTGGFGNKAINMNTVASWIIKDKDLPSKSYVDTAVEQSNQGLSGHATNKNNPHGVTKSQVGLGNVNNTADADKPISNATSAALNLKADKTQLDAKADKTQLDAKADKTELQGLATATQLDLKADKSTTYTKTEVDGVVDDIYQSLEDNFVANGAALPYDPQVTYNDGAIVVDNGALKKIEGGILVNAVNAASVSVGDSTLDQKINFINKTGLEFYVELWGAVGDGVTSDITAFTNAINDLHTAFKSDGKPRTLLLQPNKIYIGHLIKIKAGVNIKCINGLATVKRSPVPANVTEATAKWWRVFETDTTSFTTLADISHRIQLHNFVVDGNMYNSNWTWNTYNQEQASCIFLMGRNDISIDGKTEVWMRTRFDIQNVKCQNSVSDGLHISRNVDLTFGKLEFEHCFRGGLTMTGGNSIIKGDSVTAFDARIDLEVDGSGIGGSFRAWIYLSNYYQDVGQTDKERFFTGGCDFASVAGGVLHLDNVNILTPPFNLFLAKSSNEREEDFSISSSIFHSSGENIYNPTNGLFKNTKIVLRNDVRADVTLPFLLAYQNYKQDNPTELLFDGLTLEHYDQSIVATKAAVRIESQKAENLATLKFVNSDFTRLNCDTTFQLAIGGRLSVDNCKVNTPTVFGVNGAYQSGGNYPAVLEVGSIEYGNKVQNIMQTALSSTSTNQNILNFKNTEVPSNINNIMLSTGTNGVPSIYKGSRIIIGDTPPLATTHAFKGDVYKLSNAAREVGKPYEWLCVTSVGFSRTASSWIATKWLTSSFQTASLPVLTSFDVGVENLDTTLNKFVKWNGVAWV